MLIPHSRPTHCYYTHFLFLLLVLSEWCHLQSRLAGKLFLSDPRIYLLPIPSLFLAPICAATQLISEIPFCKKEEKGPSSSSSYSSFSHGRQTISQIISRSPWHQISIYPSGQIDIVERKVATLVISLPLLCTIVRPPPLRALHPPIPLRLAVSPSFPPPIGHQSSSPCFGCARSSSPPPLWWWWQYALTTV